MVTASEVMTLRWAFLWTLGQYQKIMDIFYGWRLNIKIKY